MILHTTSRRLLPIGLTVLVLATAGCGTLAGPASPGPRTADRLGVPGVLVMAHGGSPEWNAAVAAAVAPLRSRWPTAVAYGMADPTTLEAGLDSLAAAGVDRVAVVRLFLSAASFRHQTEYLLGSRADPPEQAMVGHRTVPGVELVPLGGPAAVRISDQGLSETREVPEIVVERATSMSMAGISESVVLLAHGMGSEEDNARLERDMGRSVEALAERGFRDVAAFTLREDWEEARARAEERIRAHVAARRAAGDRVLVVPYRLFGFGPYAEVLEGLVYTAGEGFLPHPFVGVWLERTAGELVCALSGAACEARVAGG